MRCRWTSVRQAGHTLRGLVALAGALRPATRSSLSGPLSAQRRFAFARSSVADVSAVRRSLGGTFNDVMLAAVTAGFRRLLLARGEPPARHVVRTLVPVSVRVGGAESVRDNQVSLLVAECRCTWPIRRSAWSPSATRWRG